MSIQNELKSNEYEEYIKGLDQLFEHGKIITPYVYQKVCRPEHVFKKYAGIGISTTEINTMILNNIKIIRIIYEGIQGRKVFISTVRQYIETPNKYTYEDIDTQKVLPFKEMIIQ